MDFWTTTFVILKNKNVLISEEYNDYYYVVRPIGTTDYHNSKLRIFVSDVSPYMNIVYKTL